MDSSKYSQLIIQQVKPRPVSDPRTRPIYDNWARLALRMGDDMVKGSFDTVCSWYLNTPAGEYPRTTSHVHNSDETIGFFGSDPQDPSDLGGEIEFWIEDEKFLLIRSSLIFIPKGVRHCPLIVRRVEHPIFHFSTISGVG